MARLSIFVAVALAILTGCAKDVSYVAPTKANLLDPLPSKALVYLLRSPYDSTTLTVFVDGKKVATLPSEHYTAISLEPGTHDFKTEVSAFLRSENIPHQALEVQANKRYFLAMPAPEKKTISGISAVAPIGGIPIPIIGPHAVETGATRAWEGITEADSHWFIFYTKPSAPEPDAL